MKITSEGKASLLVMPRLLNCCRIINVYEVNRSHVWDRAGLTGAFVDRFAETKGLDKLEKERAKHGGELEQMRNRVSLTSSQLMSARKTPWISLASTKLEAWHDARKMVLRMIL